ncbi:O-glycosyl hydrolase [Malassezia pachydermatis]
MPVLQPMSPESQTGTPETSFNDTYSPEAVMFPRSIGYGGIHSQNGSPNPEESESFYVDDPGMKAMPSMQSMRSMPTMDSFSHSYQPGLAVGEGKSSNTLYERTGYQDDESIVSSEGSEDPYPWMTMVDVKEADDHLHDPAMSSPRGSLEPWRGFFNIGTIIILTLAILMLFAGYPILHYYTMDKNQNERISAFQNIHPGGIIIPSNFPIARVNNTNTSATFGRDQRMLIDPETPEDAYALGSTYSKTEGKPFKLVFSDEFNTDGRSFYPGDDPFWEAVDLHYWGTNNLEWYDPAAIYTKDGSLRIRLEQHEEHNLYFRGGMLQSWNKFCFRNGILIARVQLPGFQDVSGLWPAFWIMGNLGRAGYGASLQGTWPYSYDYCDVGTVMNQTIFNSTYENGWPEGTVELGGATMFNQQHNTRSLSFLPGQKLSRCTCLEDKDMHPGPIDPKTGELVGRAAPEIDVFEAQTSKDHGVGVSQSCQMAPYNWQYNITHENTTDAYHIFNYKKGINDINLYNGEITQQSLSGIHLADQNAVQKVANSLDTDEGKGYFATYSLEYRGGEDGYVAWRSGSEKAWEIYPEALRPDSLSKVSHRQFPKEPMYIILNLGISKNFGNIDWANLIDGFPFELAVDWVRVYQDPDDTEADIGCDPDDMPTKDYINKYIEAYTNPNLTLWGNTAEEGGYGKLWPRNRLYTKGCSGTQSRLPGDPDRLVKASPVSSAFVTKTPGAQGSWVERPDGQMW